MCTRRAGASSKKCVCACVCTNTYMCHGVYLQAPVCVCVNEHFYSTASTLRDTLTHAPTQTRRLVGVRYGCVCRLYGSGGCWEGGGLRGRVSISTVHAQCSLSGNQLLPMATANGVAPPHDVTLLLTNAGVWFDIRFFVRYYYLQSFC